MKKLKIIQQMINKIIKYKQINNKNNKKNILINKEINN